MNERQSKPYVYGERAIEDMSVRSFKIGSGRISGVLSLTFGLLSLFAVLCFRYPRWLTTGELREVYDVELLRQLLQAAMATSLVAGIVPFLRNQHRRLGALGILATLLAYALGGADVPTGSVKPNPYAVGLDWFVLDLLFSAALFIFIEKVFPRYAAQAILRPEWTLDLVYFSVNHLAIGVLLLVGNHFAPLAFDWAVNAKLQGLVRGLPLAAQVLLLLLFADLVQYWVHRAYHEVPWLWKIHAVHHSSEHMDWLAGSRTHIVEVLLDRSLVMVPLYLLGPDKAALDIYVVIASLQAVFVHANVGLQLGWLKYLLVTPQFHHWHHSSDKPAIDTNYAVHLPLLDVVFGTFHMPDSHWPIQYGTLTRLPRTLWAQLRYPFNTDHPVTED